jgi:hypothetical protein
LLRQKTSELEQTRKTHSQLLNQHPEKLGKGDSKSEALETAFFKRISAQLK